MKLRKNKKGFSLVELMIVVVIMGILIAVAVPLYGAVVAKSEESACKANQDTIKTSFHKWVLMDSKNTATTLFKDGSTKFDGSTQDPNDVFQESYIEDCFEKKELPSCPSEDHYYVIERVSTEEIRITCMDKDGVDADHSIGE